MYGMPTIQNIGIGCRQSAVKVSSQGINLQNSVIQASLEQSKTRDIHCYGINKTIRNNTTSIAIFKTKNMKVELLQIAEEVGAFVIHTGSHLPHGRAER